MFLNHYRGCYTHVFSDGPVQERVEAVEAEGVVDELAELANFSVLDEDKVGLVMQIFPADDKNSTTP